MAVPARSVSKTRGRTRRAHAALSAKTTTKCKKCGAVIKSHRVCPKCGYYKDVQRVEKEVEETKKEKEKQN